VTNGDVVAPDDDFLDDQPDDALALKHIQILHLGTQAPEEVAQRMCEPQVCCLVAELIIKRCKFCLQSQLALSQLGHASAQFIQAEQFLLVGRQQSFNAAIDLKQLAHDCVLVLLGRMRSTRRFDTSVYLGLDQLRLLQQACDLGPHGVLEQIEPYGPRGAPCLPLIAPCVRSEAAVVGDLARGAARGSPVQGIAALGAVDEALKETRLDGAAGSGWRQ